TLQVAHEAGDSHAAPTLVAALPGWGKALVALLAVGAVVGFGRYLIRPIFRYIADAGLREAFTAFALLIVVGVAVLMQHVGLSPALGAFVAGVVLAESEFRRELETDIEPFRGLLLGLFFLTVGAGLNLPLVLADPLQIGAMVVGLLVLKGALIFGVARLSGLYWRDAGTLAAALCGGGEFAFVLFSAASVGGILPPDLASRLTASVALSMAATPLVFLAWQALSRAPAEAELTPENEAFAHSDPDAIIAGHGRFGQMVSRLLEVNGLKVATLESSVAQIALLRKFGRRVYYGDAGRLDLLRAAGAEKAKILVVAIDDSEKAVEIVRMAREAFPQLMILARAYDRRHYYELMQAGAHRIEREVFEGGLAMGAEALKALGWRAYTAERAARLFRRHDERMLESLADLWQDVERYSVAARESAPAMEDVMRADLHQMSGRAQDTWAHDKQTMSDGKEKEASTAV
ncbi:MAG: cation:proton antiporter, partial [Asticcacaulis sp.]